MFPSRQSIISFSTNQQQQQTQENIVQLEDLIKLDAYDVSMDGSGSSNHMVGQSKHKKRGRSLNGNPRNLDLKVEGTIDDHTKKSMHRDVERQRRKYMATLCVSLRNLLPLEYIKGKRSLSDHLHGAENYIKDLRKRIEELGFERDGLRKLNSSVFNPKIENSNHKISTTKSVMVHSCEVGVEILIINELEVQVLAFSRVLGVLANEGLDVLSCISTKVNGRLVHTIKCKAHNLACTDVSKLQDKLTKEISCIAGER